MAKVVNRRVEKETVYIGRGSKFGNKFRIGKDGTREEVIEKYRKWLWDEIRKGRVTIEELIALDGETLGCYCKPLACHGDVLVEAINWAKTVDNFQDCLEIDVNGNVIHNLTPNE